jgi:hypothetical protein
MRRSKPHYLNKENKTELSEELKKNNTDIDKLKQIHRNIDGLTEKVINLLNEYFKAWEDYIPLAAPGTPYQKALVNLTLKKYIPNPELEDSGILLEVKKFFTEVPEWIIDDEKNFEKDKKIYDKERKKIDLNKYHEVYEKIEKILEIRDRYGSFTIEDLNFYGLNANDRPDFKAVSDLIFNMYYGGSFVKPKGCNLQGEMVITEKDLVRYKKDIEQKKQKINSNEFKKNLELNFNKLKNIIQKVSLSKSLGRRNTINRSLNTILDRERHKDRLESQKTAEGYIYILSNKSFPNYIKIGSTMKDPRIRAQELSDTSVPFPYEVKFKIMTKNCEILEKEVHSILDKKRVDLEREFFECSVEEAKKIIEKVVEIGK